MSPEQVCEVCKEINVIVEYNGGSRFREEEVLAVGSVPVHETGRLGRLVSHLYALIRDGMSDLIE